MDIYLKHTGTGSLPGVPARDLTREEAEQYGGEELLLKSGCYVKAKPHPSENKLEDGAHDNKRRKER